MNSFPWRRAGFFGAVLFFAANFQLPAPNIEVTLTTSLSSEIKPMPILLAMQRVADWQLAHPAKEKPTGWVQAAGDAGMMALAGVSGDAKYRDAMLAMGETNDWQLGPRMYHADDQCVGQTYAELYLLYREPMMIAPLRERFDAILAKPSDVQSLDFLQPDKKALEQWSWCDTLFMAPPTWARLYAATGDERYLDFAVKNWWRTTDYLCDTNEHLFFRDSTYFDKREANGKKVFWGRGNGWVMGGLVRTLQFLPMNHPERPRFEQMFKDMAEKILSCQQPDGLWRASLLDPDSFPAKEASGSGFFTYALAWGVNQGLLDRSKFEPVVRKAWTALVGCVDADGKLAHVQPIGGDPKDFDADSTEPYGVGAFLLAGSEVYRMAVWRSGYPSEVKITNPANFWRENETVEFPLDKYFSKALINRFFSTKNFAVIDGVSSRIVTSQAYASETNQLPDKLLFQVNLAPGETRKFYMLAASALAAVPPPIVKTYARQIAERYNDIAWESDRTAHRMYHQDLIKGEGTISSGIDVWSKRTRSLVINKRYQNGDYHRDHGDGLDDYEVGKSRGGGGLGVWNGTNLYVSSNYRNARIITTGPIRSEFELTYDAWDADGRKVSETKRISIDAGSNMNRAESTFASEDPSPLEIGVGLTQRAILVGTNSVPATEVPSESSNGKLTQDLKNGWQTYWQPTDRDRGNIAVAIVLPGGIKQFVAEKASLPAPSAARLAKPGTEGMPPIANNLAIASAKVGKPFVYYFGAGWSKSGDFPDAAAWNSYVRRFVERLNEPLKVTIGN